MMKNIGVICEYNPFHNGHATQIEIIRAAFSPCRIVCAMSGPFVQRGECAVYDKYTRAKAALLSGVDLVVELPYPYAASRADTFAMAGVHILTALGCDVLCFGSESGDLACLSRIAENLDSPAFLTALSEDVPGKNESYPRRMARLYATLFGSGFPQTPNDILAVCYLRAIRKQSSPMTPFTYPRAPGYTATGARHALYAGEDATAASLIPPAMQSTAASHRPLSPLLPREMILSFFALYPGDIETLTDFDGFSPGLPTAMKRAAMESTTTADMISRLVSKRDTEAKIKRALLSALLSAPRDQLLSPPAFTRLLSANQKGRELLSALRKTSTIPILTKPAHGACLTGKAAADFALSQRADRLYLILSAAPAANAFRTGPIIIDPPTAEDEHASSPK